MDYYLTNIKWQNINIEFIIIAVIEAQELSSVQQSWKVQRLFQCWITSFGGINTNARAQRHWVDLNRRMESWRNYDVTKLQLNEVKFIHLDQHESRISTENEMSHAQWALKQFELCTPFGFCAAERNVEYEKFKYLSIIFVNRSKFFHKCSTVSPIDEHSLEFLS